jgi:hypothetical protein
MTVSSLSLLLAVLDRLARDVDMARDAISELRDELQPDDPGPPLPLLLPGEDAARRTH